MENESDITTTIGPFLANTRIAYFTMEIALRPEMHTYSGGLGVLAGDTARSCADLELPMVFVSLLSRLGYLKQSIDESGNQIEEADPWTPNDHATALRAKVAVEIANREVWVRPWLHTLTSPIGHPIPVLLLDTDLNENHPEDRRITDALYGGDDEYRLKQEIVLGICGLRILQALGFNITTFHMNEGHAALAAVDLLRRYPLHPGQVRPGQMKYDIGRVRNACVFTTHTPVESGHDQFDYGLVHQLLAAYIDIDQLKLLAGEKSLNMTLLALRLSGYVNGVAERHALTAAKMFGGYKVRAITNGIHLPSWVHPRFAETYTSRFPQWGLEPEVLVRADQLPDDEVWNAHSAARGDLVKLVRDRTGTELDPNLALVGFARRMTAYKRPDLLFSDIPRLLRICERHPFQLVMAGKAHRRDHAGKAAIARVNALARELKDKIKIVFLPNYDLALARVLVPGVDIWLNTPVPPMEASGTSGMKAAANGVLNLSVLDGWWVEACIDGVNGWSVGDDDHADGRDAQAGDLYDKLDRVVLPAFYQDRDHWIWMMKQSISKVAYHFNTQRMMRRYAAEAYLQRGTGDGRGGLS